MSLITNLARIEQHNQQFDYGNTTYSIGLNQFADLSEQEFSGLFGSIDNSVEGFVLQFYSN